jgi:hypothetical protein
VLVLSDLVSEGWRANGRDHMRTNLLLVTPDLSPFAEANLVVSWMFVVAGGPPSSLTTTRLLTARTHLLPCSSCKKHADLDALNQLHPWNHTKYS